jgi:hypothetical protein
MQAYGEVSWKTPIKDFKEVVIEGKVDSYSTLMPCAMDNGSNFVNSSFFMINEPYFASTDGFLIVKMCIASNLHLVLRLLIIGAGTLLPAKR